MPIIDFRRLLPKLSPQDQLPIYMVQMASWFADATEWQMESRHRHGTYIIPSSDLITEFPTAFSTSTSIGDAANIWCLPAAPLWWSNAMINLQADLREASAQMAAKGLSFRLQAPTFVPLKRERPKRPREYWLEHSFQLPADKEPRPAWRYLPRPGYQLQASLQYLCTVIASIAHWPTFLHLLRMTWTMEGWMDTLPYLDEWDEDGTYDHLDLALGGHDAPGVL
jgi:hypothetical protein